MYIYIYIYIYIFIYIYIYIYIYILLRRLSPVHTRPHTHLHAHSIQCSFAYEIARQWLIRRCLCTCVREICVCERGTERKFGSELCGWVFA